MWMNIYYQKRILVGPHQGIETKGNKGKCEMKTYLLTPWCRILLKN
jgi:hypothetical protein